MFFLPLHHCEYVKSSFSHSLVYSHKLGEAIHNSTPEGNALGVLGMIKGVDVFVLLEGYPKGRQILKDNGRQTFLVPDT